MKRDKAISTIQVDNEFVRITKFSFPPGTETGMHKHSFDYVITPITDGKVTLIDKNGKISNADLVASEAYFRKAGIEHNVINNGKNKLVFIETELKNIRGKG